MAGAAEEFRVFFEMLPHVLRDEGLRRRIALLYRWYWGIKLEWLGVGDPSGALDDPDLLGLTQLLSAVIDGLAIQAAIDPSLDLANPCRILYRMLVGVMPPFDATGGRAAVSPGSPSADVPRCRRRAAGRPRAI